MNGVIVAKYNYDIQNINKKEYTVKMVINR